MYDIGDLVSYTLGPGYLDVYGTITEIKFEEGEYWYRMAITEVWISEKKIIATCEYAPSRKQKFRDER